MEKTESLASTNPLNIDGQAFDTETYLSKLLKEKSLRELMDCEHEMVAEVKKLDSEMQTLVYENYNKFIAATDTIRKMKQDFVQMEDEMDKLAQNMAYIASYSEKVTCTLDDSKSSIQKLAKSCNTLKNLEYILDLPSKLSEYCERKEYALAVKAYKSVEPVLLKYKDFLAFNGIQKDCELVVADLKQHLRDNFKTKLGSAKDLSATMQLLLQLGEPAKQLLEDYLALSKVHIQADLSELESKVKSRLEEVGAMQPSIEAPVDILEFIDIAASGFLSNSSLVIAAYNELFIKKPLPGLDPVEAQQAASTFVEQLMSEYFSIIEARFSVDTDHAVFEDSSLMVRALDRFNRRLQAVSRLVPETDYALSSLELVLRISYRHIDCALQQLKTKFKDHLNHVRQKLVVGRSGPELKDQPHNSLRELTEQMEKTVQYSLKSTMANLLQFTASDVSFSTNASFYVPFGVAIRERLCVGFFKYIKQCFTDMLDTANDKASVTPTLVLLSTRICITMESSLISYILNLCEQQYRIEHVCQPGGGLEITSVNSIIADFQVTAQSMLDHFVAVEGSRLSQLLCKSVDTRDWLSCVEPRNVRAAMKRIVEDLTAIDVRVGQLYDNGSTKDQDSNSSRRTTGLNYSFSYLPSTSSTQKYKPVTGRGLASSIDNPLLKKLWSEKVDYFASVEFTKDSVLSSLVKIALKTLLESIRLKVFGKYGLQQLQVDAHYLEIHLWRFVSDENLVQHLLEEVMASAVLRCFEPVLMEPAILNLICEKS